VIVLHHCDAADLSPFSVGTVCQGVQEEQTDDVIWKTSRKGPKTFQGQEFGVVGHGLNGIKSQRLKKPLTNEEWHASFCNFNS